MHDIFLSKNFLVKASIIALLYLIIATYLMNLSLVIDTFIGSYSMMYKFKLLTALLRGMWTSMGPSILFPLSATAFLTCANLTLLTQRISSLGKAGNVHLAVGGSTILGLATTGCASCGLPIISILGLSGSLFFLPFKGAELPYISVIFLIISLYFLVKSEKDIKACKI